MTPHRNSEEVYNTDAWKDGFQAGYDQVINEMLYWLFETKRKTIPSKWVTARQSNLYDPQHSNLHRLIDERVREARINEATGVYSWNYKAKTNVNVSETITIEERIAQLTQQREEK